MRFMPGVRIDRSGISFDLDEDGIGGRGLRGLQDREWSPGAIVFGTILGGLIGRSAAVIDWYGRKPGCAVRDDCHLYSSLPADVQVPAVLLGALLGCVVIMRFPSRQLLWAGAALAILMVGCSLVMPVLDFAGAILGGF